MKRILRLVLLATLSLPGMAQQADISVIGGSGVDTGDDQDTFGVVTAGASFGIPHSSRHRFQLDYLFTHQFGGNYNLPANLHFVTGSYVVQGKSGRTRPFFQVGAGLVQRSVDGYFSRSSTNPALVLGGGATIAIGRSIFIRPQVRLYGHSGLGVTIIPSAAVGFRF